MIFIYAICLSYAQLSVCSTCSHTLSSHGSCLICDQNSAYEESLRRDRDRGLEENTNNEIDNQPLSPATLRRRRISALTGMYVVFLKVIFISLC